MSRLRWSLCGLHLGSVGVYTVILYLIDKTIAQSFDGSAPDQDYPVYTDVPQGLSFTCDDKIPGYYADTETMCQVWHWCVPGIGGNIMYSFVCGPGTAFNQQTRVCDWIFKVDCPNSPAYYSINEDLYKDEAGNYIVGNKDNTYDNNIFDQRRLAARKKRMENVRKNHTKRHTTIQNTHKRNIRDRGATKFRQTKTVDI